MGTANLTFDSCLSQDLHAIARDFKILLNLISLIVEIHSVSYMHQGQCYLTEKVTGYFNSCTSLSQPTFWIIMATNGHGWSVVTRSQDKNRSTLVQCDSSVTAAENSDAAIPPCHSTHINKQVCVSPLHYCKPAWVQELAERWLSVANKVFGVAACYGLIAEGSAEVMSPCKIQQEEGENEKLPYNSLLTQRT